MLRCCFQTLRPTPLPSSSLPSSLFRYSTTTPPTSPRMHVVLVQPSIPQNAGGIGRTCLGLDASLHLVGPLGFSLEDKYVKRAGMDYWQNVDVTFHENWEAFKAADVTKKMNSFTFLSRFAEQTILENNLIQPAENLEEKDGVALVFGSESKGLYVLLGEEEMMAMPNPTIVKIPSIETPQEEHQFRSFNLATSVGIVAWEAWKELHGFKN